MHSEMVQVNAIFKLCKLMQVVCGARYHNQGQIVLS